MAYNEEDIFNSDSIELILRFGDHTREYFDKAKNQENFERIKNLIDNEEVACYFSKQTDTEHKIIIPLNDLGGQFEVVATWHKTFTYEIKVNKQKKSKYKNKKELPENQYSIEQNCKIRFIGMDEQYDNFENLRELSDLKKRVDSLEIAPKTLIENQRDIWTKYIEAQELLIKKLQEPFACSRKYNCAEIKNTKGDITRFKFKVDLVTDRNDEYKIFEEELKNLDIEETFNSDGTILLKLNDVFTGLDTIIQRKYSEQLEREQSIGCIIKICPQNIEQIIQNQINKQLSHIKVFRKKAKPNEVFVSNFAKSKIGKEVEVISQILNDFDFEVKQIEFKINISNLEKEEWVSETREIYKIEYKGIPIPTTKKTKILVPIPNNNIVTIRLEEEDKHKFKKYFDVLCEIYGHENVNIEDVWYIYSTEKKISEEVFSDEFWRELKRDLFETGINQIEFSQTLAFDFVERDELLRKYEFLRGLKKFDFILSPLSEDFKFKVKTNLIAKKTAKQIFMEKIEKLRGVEFAYNRVKEDSKRPDSIFIGKLSANESTTNQLVFNIPY
jgi:hypothetical protein